MTGDHRKLPTEEGLETAWKWALRLLGLISSAYVVFFHPEVPGYCYVLLGGLLGLPTALDQQIRKNRERDRRRDRD